jgi:hypothetical protein
MLPNSKHFKGRRMLELWDGTRMNSQVGVQDEINLHNQEKRVVITNQMKVVRWI